jgi:hypothetical protein
MTVLVVVPLLPPKRFAKAEVPANVPGKKKPAGRLWPRRRVLVARSLLLVRVELQGHHRAATMLSHGSGHNRGNGAAARHFGGQYTGRGDVTSTAHASRL